MSLETLKPKVAALIKKAQSGGGDDFIGIKYSNFESLRNLPKTADARSLDKMLQIDNYEFTDQNHALTYAFANTSKTANGGYFSSLEEVYLPTHINALNFTFQYCINLTTIHGDLSTVENLIATFINCTSLDINAVIARMSNLKTIGASSFQYCTQLTEITLPDTVKTIHTGAFNGCTNITDIYCPWAEGAVANAPWGATNATIHYNSEV